MHACAMSCRSARSERWRGLYVAVAAADPPALSEGLQAARQAAEAALETYRYTKVDGSAEPQQVWSP